MSKMRLKWPGELGTNLPRARAKREEARRQRYGLLFEHFGITKEGRPTNAFLTGLASYTEQAIAPPTAGYSAQSWQQLAIALAERCVPGLNAERTAGRPGTSWEDIGAMGLRPLAQMICRRPELSLAEGIRRWQKAPDCVVKGIKPETVVRQTAKTRQRIITNARKIGYAGDNWAEAMRALERNLLRDWAAYRARYTAELAEAEAMPDPRPPAQNLGVAANILVAYRPHEKELKVSVAKSNLEFAEQHLAEQEMAVAGYGDK